jgi:hypothetical protein
MKEKNRGRMHLLQSMEEKISGRMLVHADLATGTIDDVRLP